MTCVIANAPTENFQLAISMSSKHNLEFAKLEPQTEIKCLSAFQIFFSNKNEAWGGHTTAKKNPKREKRFDAFWYDYRLCLGVEPNVCVE